MNRRVPLICWAALCAILLGSCVMAPPPPGPVAAPPVQVTETALPASTATQVVPATATAVESTPPVEPESTSPPGGEETAPAPATSQLPVPPVPTPPPTPTELPEEGISASGETYVNTELGLVWSRPDASWQFNDISFLDGLFGEMIPLVALAPAGDKQGGEILLFTLELPAPAARLMTLALKLAPEIFAEEVDLGLAGLGETTDITEVDGAPTIVTAMDTGTAEIGYFWMIIRPQGMLVLLAQGFDAQDEAAALLTGLDIVETPLTPLADLRGEALRARLMADVERLRELNALQQVDFDLMDRGGLRARLESEMAEGLGPDELAAQERLLKLLGLLPSDADLLDLLLDLQESQVLGFYDDEADTFFLIDEQDQEQMQLDLMDQITFVHEYAHALQDQHFDLSRLSNAEELGYNDDETAALQALVEGDASLVMMFWMLENISLDQFEELAQNAAGELDVQVLEQTPDYLQQTMMFPYENGLEFVMTIVLEQGWDALNQVWADPPASTEQILHPQRYGVDDPTLVSLPVDVVRAPGAGWDEVLRDVWGEFDLRAMLAQVIGEEQAAAGADGWDGSQYVFLTNDGQELLVMELAWDDESEAREGGNALASWLEKSGIDAVADGHFVAADRSAFLKTVADRTYLVLTTDTAVLDTILTELGWIE